MLPCKVHVPRDPGFLCDDFEHGLDGQKNVGKIATECELDKHIVIVRASLPGFFGLGPNRLLAAD